MDPGGAAGGGCPCPRAGQANQATLASEALGAATLPHPPPHTRLGRDKQEDLQGAG